MLIYILYLQFEYQLSLFYLNSYPLSHLHLPLSISVILHLPSEIQDHIYCGHSIKTEAKVYSNSVYCQSNSDLHLGTTLTVYLNSYSPDTMTCSTLTSFHASRQPSRQPSEQPISTRLSPVPEPSPSQVPESIIDRNEAINLMLPGCQQGSPPDPNNVVIHCPNAYTVMPKKLNRNQELR